MFFRAVIKHLFVYRLEYNLVYNANCLLCIVFSYLSKYPIKKAAHAVVGLRLGLGFWFESGLRLGSGVV